MSRPRPVEGDETPCINGSTEDILRYEISLIPDQDLFPEGMRCMLSLPDAHKPLPIRVVVMLEPLIDEHIRSIMIESLADQLAHGKTGRRKYGIVSLCHRGGRFFFRFGCCVMTALAQASR